MAANPFPTKFNDLSTMTIRFTDGLATHGPELGIERDPVLIKKALDAATVANTEYQAILGERTSVLTPALTTADSEGRVLIAAAVKLFRVKLGERWNQSWSEAGFVNNSTAIPKTQARREALLKSLGAYLLSHPELESADLKVTAARATALFEAIGTAQKNLQENKAQQGELRGARDKAVATLRKRLRAAIGDLGAVLENDSPLWNAFGLNEPVRPSKKDVAKATEKAAIKLRKAAERSAETASKLAQKAAEKAVDADAKAKAALSAIPARGAAPSATERDSSGTDVALAR